MDNFERWWSSLLSYKGSEKEIARKAYNAGFDEGKHQIDPPLTRYVDREVIMTNSLATVIIGIVVTVSWIAGIVLAKGIVQTLCAFFPPYAWYLVIERIMTSMGWV